MKIRKIAINTGGGDAPGLNAVIRAVVLGAEKRGWECWGIRQGFRGLLEPEAFQGKGVIRLSRPEVRGITHLGGTIIGTTNAGNPLHYPVKQPDGSVIECDRGDELIALLRAQGFDALVSVGGDGSLSIAAELDRRGFPVVGVPKTIDNDLDRTSVTFGFNTAVSFATECLDRLHTTAESHNRVMVVEVMGRYAGWIALWSGIAGGADVILIPEIPYDLHAVVKKIEDRRSKGRAFSLVIVAEGATPKGGKVTIQKAAEVGTAERLGGIGHVLERQLKELTGQETRAVVLGHLLRGGSPTTYDRMISLRFGAAAVRALAEGHHGCMVALDPPNVQLVPLEQATKRMKLVPLDGDIIMTARDLGICLGD